MIASRILFAALAALPLAFTARAEEPRVIQILTTQPPEPVRRVTHAGKEVLIDQWSVLERNCQLEGDVDVRIVEAPAHGRLRVAAAPARPNQATDDPRRACDARPTTAKYAYYTPARDFSGVDRGKLEILYPDGNSWIREFSVTVWDRPPKVIKGQGPAYPEDAIRRKVEGSVLALVHVDAEGRVGKVTVRRSPDEQLSAAAVASIEKWIFRPPKVAGSPVAHVGEYELTFRLSDVAGESDAGGEPPPR